jgi:NCS2 family nucleobase:cation symporter-2
MAASRVYSTLAYIIAGVGAILLALSPKFGAVLAATPAGVKGGVTVALFGMIGVLGARIWIDAKVDFANTTDLSWTSGKFAFSGIINATLMAVVGYQIFTRIAKARQTNR